MIAAIAYLLIALAVVTVYSFVLLAVYVPVAYRNGLAEGRRQAQQNPSNVTLLPAQRGGAA